MATNEALQRYWSAVADGVEILGQASTAAGERGYAISKQFASDMIASQREAVQLAKNIVDDPEHFMSVSYAGVTEAAVAAQSRALAFAQLTYQQAVAASTEAREVSEKLAKATRESAEAAADLSRAWGAANPLTEWFARSAEAGAQGVEGSARRQRKPSAV